MTTRSKKNPAHGVLTVARWQLLDWAIACALGVFMVLLWWPTRALPYHWDAATFIIRATRDLVASGYSPLIAEHSEFAHPPLFVAALGGTWLLFGESIAVSHLFVLPLVVLAPVSTYALGRVLHSRSVGVIAALFLATTPVFVSEIGQIYVDLPIVGLSTTALLLWFRGRPALCALLLCVCAAIKIPTLIFACSLLLVGSFVPSRRRRLFWLAAPFVTVLIWLLYHHAVTGWWLSRPGLILYRPQGVAELLRNATAVSRLLLGQWRGLVALVGLCSAIAIVVKQRPRLRLSILSVEQWTLLFCVLGGIGFFALAGEFGQRYGLMLMPPIFLLAAMAIRNLMPASNVASWGGCAILTAIFVAGWIPDSAQTPEYSIRPDPDLGYMDLVSVGVDTANYLQKEHPDARVFGTFPESYWLGEPFQGYTKRAFVVQDCRRYRSMPSLDTVIIAHLYSAKQVHCWSLIKLLHATLIRKIRSNSKWVGIFEVPRPSSQL